MKGLEELKSNWQPKRIELWVDLEEFEPGSIFTDAYDILQSKSLEQVNSLWMDFEAVPNMYEEIKVEFQNMDLFFQVIQKIYFVEHKTLNIEINLKLLE